MKLEDESVSLAKLKPTLRSQARSMIVDINDIFFFPRPWKKVGDTKYRTTSLVDFNYPDEIMPDFVERLGRLVSTIRDVVDDVNTQPLVGDAVDLEARLEVGNL